MSGIVDAHHHIWRIADLPWLQAPMTPRIFGAYDPIKRDYLAAEYIADVAARGVTASVYVQPNWPLDRCLDEVRWVHGVYEETGWPSAIVAGADMFCAGTVELFAAQRDASPLVRGVRQQLHWHENEQYRYAATPDAMRDPVFRDNIAALGELGWVFELQVFPSQMADAAALVADFPDVTFVLAHAGMLETTAAEHVEPWRRGLRRLAALPNVYCLLSGAGTFVHRVDRELIATIAGAGIELFGADRCLWGSNLPVEKIWTDAATLIDTWRAVLADYPAATRDAVLGATARRVYGL